MERKFLRSDYLQVLPLDDTTVLVAHGLRGTREILEKGLLTHLGRYKGEGVSLQEFARAAGISMQEAQNVHLFFVRAGFVVEAGSDEEFAIRESCAKNHVTPSSPGSLRRAPNYDILFKRATSSIAKSGLVTSEQGAELRILMLGACLSQLAKDMMVEYARELGRDATVRFGWIDNVELVDEMKPELVIFQPSTASILEPLFDQAAFCSDEERRARLESAKSQIGIRIKGLLERLKGGTLLLAQGVASPQYSPFGRTDFRQGLGVQRAVAELNFFIQDLIRTEPNAIFVDEEQVFGNAGKYLLLDDAVAPYSHHGPLDFYGTEGAVAPAGPTREETFGILNRLEAVRLLAREYLNCFVLWNGARRIKCVICDLDGTLWPGVLGDSPKALEGSAFVRTFQYGAYGGIHQALKILKSRGILLASCSKNTESVALEFWTALAQRAKAAGISHFLSPDDFVAHKINWSRKSENILALSKALGVHPDAMLFLDDNPVEREEVSCGVGGIRVLGENLNLVRTALLSDPSLQNNFLTEEATHRTEMVRSQLKREEARAQIPNELEFLRSLNIRMRIEKVTEDAVVPRVAELIQRTNQFNTSQIRYDASELLEMIHSGSHSIFAMWVQDRFADYGLVGVCVVKGQTVENLVISCRVIGLGVEVPFVCSVIRSSSDGSDATWSAEIRKTDRNSPCHHVFASCGFVEIVDGKWSLKDLSELERVPSVHDVRFAS